MRRLFALLLLLPGALVATMLSAPPADAGGNSPVEVHGFSTGSWSLRSYDCAGVADSGTTYRLEATDVRLAGLGSLRVTTGPDSIGGVLRFDSKYLRTLSYSVYDDGGGTDPHARWYVHTGNHVIESDPLPITTGAWTTLEIGTATLHEGDWSGTIDEWIALHGWPGHWTAGILTGGCLGSPRVHIDKPRDKGYVYNLEPSDWSTFELAPVYHVRYGSSPAYGDSVDLLSHVRHTDLSTGSTTPVAGARVELFRRYGHERWTSVATARTDDAGKVTFSPRALRTAHYQVRIGKAGRPTMVHALDVPVYLDLGVPRLNGQRCDLDGSEACSDQTMSGDTLTLSGRLLPGGTVGTGIRRVGSGSDGRHAQRVSPDAHGHWSVTFRVRSGASYHWWVQAAPPSRQLEAPPSYDAILEVR